MPISILFLHPLHLVAYLIKLTTFPHETYVSGFEHVLCLLFLRISDRFFLCRIRILRFSFKMSRCLKGSPSLCKYANLASHHLHRPASQYKFPSRLVELPPDPGLLPLPATFTQISTLFAATPLKAQLNSNQCFPQNSTSPATQP